MGPIPQGSAALFAEIAELKRVRSAQSAGRSLADVGFRRAWARLVAGDDAEAVAATEIAFAAAHVALGPVDAQSLELAGLSVEDRRDVYRRAALRVFDPLDETLTLALEGLASATEPPGEVPRFVELLCAQPRAGAVSAGAPRLVLSPEEMHSEHCWSTAVIAALIQRARSEPAGDALLLGLVHHAANAHLPDGGFAAEVLLSDELERIFITLIEKSLAEVPSELADDCRRVLKEQHRTSSSLGTAFNAADVVDRVLQQRHYANLAGFSLSDAMDTRELVHPGPLQAFQFAVLSEIGLAF